MTNPYKKSVAHLDTIDVYKIADLYEINDNRQFHALKKILCAGKRGAKGKRQDMEEAKQSIQDWLDNDDVVNIPLEVLEAAKQHDWAKWVAQDGDGHWWAYENKPVIYEWGYDCREIADVNNLNIKTDPTNWRRSLTWI